MAALTAPTLSLDPFADDFLDDPFPRHAQLRDAGAVVRLEHHAIFAMARFADVETALRDPVTYCSGRGVGITDFGTGADWPPQSIILEADPPDHTVARKVLTGAMTPRVVKGMREHFARVATAMVSPLVGRGRFDGVAELGEAYPLRVFPEVLGMPREGIRDLLPFGRFVFNAFGPRNENTERAAAAAVGVRERIMAMTARDVLSPDGLGARIHEVADEHDVDDAIRPLLVRAFFSAGVDTTINGIGSALLRLALAPDQWALLRADPGLARAAFEETIRLESPVQTFFRTTTRDVDVDGVRIPEGAKVLLFLGAANRDPRRWQEPDRFDITRRAAGHVGFGAGLHACVGQMLARLEGESVLRALAAAAEHVELDGEPVRHRNNTLRGLRSLPLRVSAV